LFPVRYRVLEGAVRLETETETDEVVVDETVRKERIDMNQDVDPR
jgi:hypothetical protein